MTARQVPPGYSVRPIRLSEDDGYPDGPDVDLAHQVVHQVEQSLLSEPDLNREAIRHQLSSPEAALQEHRLVLDASGRPVGVLIVEVDPVGRRIFLEPSAIPGEGVLLSALIDMGLQAAPRLCGGKPGWGVETGAYATDEPARTALLAAGFAPVRRFWRMQVDFDGPVPEPEPPPGVTRTVAVSQADRRVLHSIFESSFADHFGSVPERFEAWKGWFEARRDALPQTWWIAWLDGDPVGGIVQDASRAERGLGYVRSVGVLSSVRRRGIAGWLLQCAFADAAKRGLRGMSLGVDSENGSGAVRLYERHGMRAVHVVDLYRRPLGEESRAE